MSTVTMLMQDVGENCMWAKACNHRHEAPGAP